jgi:hypothetical protein
MRRFWSSSLFLVLGLVVVVIGCKQKATPTSEAETPLPDWKPDSALLDKLAEETELEGYLVRPPKGYAKTTPPGGPPGAKFTAWSGVARPDGTSPMFMIMVGSPPPKERLPSLNGFLTLMIDPVKQRHQNWSQTASERGTLNGLTFLRTRWSGTEPGKGWKMHGIMYVAIDGRNFIQLASQDLEPHHEQALKLGETAVQTFRKK